MLWLQCCLRVGNQEEIRLRIMYFIVDGGMQTPVLRLVASEAMSGSVFMSFLSVKQRMVVAVSRRKMYFWPIGEYNHRLN
ncbi:unnamed protein product [Alopecurus aequalis]